MPATRIAQLAAVALASALALAATLDYARLRASTRELTARLGAFGSAERDPGAVAEVAGETDRLRAGLKAARILLAEELDRRWLEDLPETERARAVEQGVAKLELARSLSREALEARPGSWQASMILGGSRYLLARRRNLPGRWLHRSSWEKPLLRAAELAARQPEPHRVLAAAYLSEWSVIAEAERLPLLAVLADAFRDLDTLDQLLPIWLQRAESLEQAFGILPDDARAWRQVEHYFRTRRDWQRFRDARVRLNETLPAYLDGLLGTAARALAAGDRRIARSLALSAIDETPLRIEYRDALVEGLDLLPAGPVSERQAAGFKARLDWVVELCLVSGCPLPAATAQRLAGLAREDLPSRQALAALVAGELGTGVAIETRSMAVPKEEWHPYLLLKGKILAERGLRHEAVRVLRSIPAAAETRVLTRALLVELAGADGEGGADVIDSGWFGSSTNRRLRIFSPRPVAVLRLRFDRVGEGGAAIEARVNGELAGFFAVESGSTIELPVSRPQSLVAVELVREGGAPFRVVATPRS